MRSVPAVPERTSGDDTRYFRSATSDGKSVMRDNYAMFKKNLEIYVCTYIFTYLVAYITSFSFPFRGRRIKNYNSSTYLRQLDLDRRRRLLTEEQCRRICRGISADFIIGDRGKEESRSVDVEILEEAWKLRTGKRATSFNLGERW